MTGMTVICQTCNQSIDYNLKGKHHRDCRPGEPSDIAVIPPSDPSESEALPTDKHGRVTVGDRREHAWCSICEQDVFQIQLKSHQAKCHSGSPSDIALAEKGADPECSYCNHSIEREKYKVHVRRCGVSQSGSDYGTL